MKNEELKFCPHCGSKGAKITRDTTFGTYWVFCPVCQSRGGHRYSDITIEPILDFDIEPFLMLLRNVEPDFINIGADSGHNHLPEPKSEKIRELIKELEKITEVRLKKNLKRLLPEHELYGRGNEVV